MCNGLDPRPSLLSSCMLIIYFIPGNASQVSDGAAAVLLTRRSVAKRLGLPIIGKFVTAAVVGVPPRIMGLVSRLVSLQASTLRAKPCFSLIHFVNSSLIFCSIGPAYAIPKVLKQTGLQLSDIDFYEINEAFASQVHSFPISLRSFMTRIPGCIFGPTLGYSI